MASLINSTATALTERLITSSDGAQIFAQAVGNPRLPTLVFIHGFALSTLVWASILQNADLLRYFRLVSHTLLLSLSSDARAHDICIERLPTTSEDLVGVQCLTPLQDTARSFPRTISWRSQGPSTRPPNQFWSDGELSTHVVRHSNTMTDLKLKEYGRYCCK